MDKKKEAKPNKKGFFAVLKESMTKTSEGCGPGCGCHVDDEKEKKKAKGAKATEESRQK